ncbi:MAG: ABC transporter ATP-binding protein [Acidobacteria bacterium]|nr:MAG: ABC transporter ATP-binding protein [Acidobacteriota bacterium]
MSNLLISAQSLGKKYKLGELVLALSLRDRVTDAVRSIGKKKRAPAEFWALRDVSFDLHDGEVIGVIGRNGAGKSTLLKIISRITEPTEGAAHLYGRVSSLLEVGVGFHPELSGRENVFLNGAILSMSRVEIRRKFDEIVAFAEVEQFIDTPVKRYSSGMYVRLAFAVAAHLEPDVLIVDEVLAVGDIAFQRKCLGKMEDIRRTGRAVLVVSHNMSLISQLCENVLWLDGGKVVRSGPTREVIAAYMAQGVGGSAEWIPDAPLGDTFEYHRVWIDGGSGDAGTVAADRAFDIVYDFTVKKPMHPGRLALLIASAEGTPIFTSTSTDRLSAIREPWKLGRQRVRCTIPGHLLVPGRYFVTISEQVDMVEVLRERIFAFTVTEQNSLTTRDARLGIIAPLLEWRAEECS